MNQNIRKNQRLLWILAICTFCAGVFYFLKPLIVSSSFPDFSSYYYGSLAAAVGDNPYDGGQHFFTPFVYPPSLLLFFYPLTIFPYQMVERLFTVCSMCAYLVSLGILDFLYTKSQPRILRLALLGVLLATFFPAKFTFGMGQVNSIVLLFITLFLYFSKKRNDLAASLFLALSLATKLFPGVLILFLLFQKKWNILFTATCFLLIIGAITIFATGPSIVLTFLTSTLPHLLLSPKTDYYNQSIPGIIARLVSDPGLAQSLTGLYAVVLISPLLFFSDLHEEKYTLGIILSIVSSLLINTFAWQHHFILTLPAFFILLSPKFTSGNPYYRTLLGLSYILIAANITTPNVIWKPLWSHLTFGGMILWGLLVYRIMMFTPAGKKHIGKI